MRKFALMSCAILVWMAFSPPANADLVLQFGNTFSGTSPTGTAPWLKATFHDTAANTVQVTLTNELQSASEFISEVYFNINPALGNPFPGLSIVYNSGIPYISSEFGTNCCKADGDGKYDVRFQYLTSFGPGRFEHGDTSVYTLSLPGLTADSFEFLSAPNGGSGPFLAAAHVQGIGPATADSGWISGDVTSVPEPASILLLLTVGGGLLVLRRRRV